MRGSVLKFGPLDRKIGTDGAQTKHPKEAQDDPYGDRRIPLFGRSDRGGADAQAFGEVSLREPPVCAGIADQSSEAAQVVLDGLRQMMESSASHFDNTLSIKGYKEQYIGVECKASLAGQNAARAEISVISHRAVRETRESQQLWSPRAP